VHRDDHVDDKEAFFLTSVDDGCDVTELGVGEIKPQGTVEIEERFDNPMNEVIDSL
jgi:hypothetical protein